MVILYMVKTGKVVGNCFNVCAFIIYKICDFFLGSNTFCFGFLPSTGSELLTNARFSPSLLMLPIKQCTLTIVILYIW
ncbi:hypothetical protein BDP27DRAFT_1319267 [Rhodocollybia butyracea]|uniref:Uncharacterized protein n=1 Tax=Rhodocollybia butyracea TaxID=206335 RepID=A0A9P5Q2Q3_9AGAR|nr:hypothetical protein BDP27DRAFT_1319267 [Rhodocollybia butyracea]